VQFEVIRTHNDAYQDPHYITFEETLYNVGGGMDGPKGSFVAPEEGLYLFEFGGIINNTAVNITVNLKDRVTSKLTVLSRVMDVLPMTYDRYSTYSQEFRTGVPTLRPLSSAVTVNLKKGDEILLRQETKYGFYYMNDGTTRLRFSGRKMNEERPAREIIGMSESLKEIGKNRLERLIHERSFPSQSILFVYFFALLTLKALDPLCTPTHRHFVEIGYYKDS
jgi:hypothetical protein